MPKAGHYEFPVRDLDSCLEYLRKAHHQTQNLSLKRDTFAEALGVSPKTGPFGILVGSMVHYGLVDTGDGYIRYTDLAKKALWGEPEERGNAKHEAVRHVTLFDDIHKKYPTGVSDDQLRLFLRESAGVDVTDAPSVAVDVSKIFKKVYSYLESGNGNQKLTNGGGDVAAMGDKLKPDFEEYMLGEGIQLRLPKEHLTEAWAKTKKAIDALLDIQAQGDQN